ncbi:MAG: ABC transporter permease [Chloroflexi bacterium HGW-Chloroflexi-5]|jgi:ABC-2 type transport system permease protein|nr:MAG: ABC transporter permease [Chloroflexi bacterium HGW-Chloroflexi-5]
MKIVKLIWSYLRIGIANEMQYRVNFFIQLLQSFIALATGLIGLWLVFNHTTELGGWSHPELLAVMGIYMGMGGFIQSAIQPNMTRLQQEIQEGTLDFALTKPVDAQFLISIREFRFWQLTDVVVGLVVLVIAVVQMQVQIGIWQALAFAAALVLGGIMIYCFWLMITTSAFWLIRIWELVNLFQGLYAAGRWPVTIYPDWLRIGLTFLVPVAFAVTVPAQALTGRLTSFTLLGAFGLTILLAALARIIWQLGVRSYSGASA